MAIWLISIGLLQFFCYAASFNIRLVGGPSNYSGRVEIKFNETWGTICGDEFSNANAVVVCRMLNFSTAGAQAFRNLTGYPNAPSKIWLHDIVCTGYEKSIADCKHRSIWGSNTCNHNEDVGVKCSSSGPTDNEGDDMNIIVISTVFGSYIVILLLVCGISSCQRTGRLCFSHRHQKASEERDQPNLHNASQTEECSRMQVLSKGVECEEEYDTVEIYDDAERDVNKVYGDVQDTNGGKMGRNKYKTKNFGGNTSYANDELDEEGYVRPTKK